MKNYIGNDAGNWDTSVAYVKRMIMKCIESGRDYRATGTEASRTEAYRLLGSAVNPHHSSPTLASDSDIRWVASHFRRFPSSF